MFSDYYGGIKLEINNRNISEKSPNIWKTTQHKSEQFVDQGKNQKGNYKV